MRIHVSRLTKNVCKPSLDQFVRSNFNFFLPSRPINFVSVSSCFELSLPGVHQAIDEYFLRYFLDRSDFYLDFSNENFTCACYSSSSSFSQTMSIIIFLFAYIYMRIINIKRDIPFSSRGGGGRRVASYIYEIIYTRNCMGACVCVCDRRH